ncbi:MAG TPA: CARDB domain-containing protein [Pseudobacteroides sp.]|uniref:CARDB domain-containing protein n=1 Tax=Pseudobacteroides sp. TaxID=1968840 RepID=UPI002F943EDB
MVKIVIILQNVPQILRRIETVQLVRHLMQWEISGFQILPGEYLLTFNIDSENKIDEANEENNKITVKFYVDDYADSASGAKEIRIWQDVKGYLSTYSGELC